MTTVKKARVPSNFKSVASLRYADMLIKKKIPTPCRIPFATHEIVYLKLNSEFKIPFKYTKEYLKE